MPNDKKHIHCRQERKQVKDTRKKTKEQLQEAATYSVTRGVTLTILN